ncbi:MAG: helix-hairpin-helix domain-containing protein [Solobacterium sp.]|nr:helix-hairpin-helix domain-containing protein [Solobacterium sp.]
MKRLLIFFLLVLSGCLFDVKPVNLKQLQKETILVTVTGEVEEEGEFELPVYATVQDALDVSIPKENADLSSVNPEQILHDRDRIVIRKQTEEEIIRISINQADLEELCQLPGIGESTARKIIEYREENGYFQSLEDLMRVPGIGEAKFEKIKDMITL